MIDFITVPEALPVVHKTLVYARLIGNVELKYKVSLRGHWTQNYVLLPVSALSEVIGIIDFPERVCILRKQVTADP